MAKKQTALEKFRAENQAADAAARAAVATHDEARAALASANALEQQAHAEANAAKDAAHAKLARREILSVSAGKVKTAGPTETGLVVLVQSTVDGKPQNYHYGHCKAICVAEGDTVAVDDLIGWH